LDSSKAGSFGLWSRNQVRNQANFGPVKGLKKSRKTKKSKFTKGAVSDGSAAPAPPGVCATGRGVAAPPLLLVANIVLFRVQGCEEGITAGGI
jgi:hypothetical protein